MSTMQGRCLHRRLPSRSVVITVQAKDWISICVASTLRLSALRYSRRPVWPFALLEQMLEHEEAEL